MFELFHLQDSTKLHINYEFVNVKSRFEEFVSLEMEESHSLLSEVSRMILVHEGSVMKETSSITSTCFMLSVSSNSTMTEGNVASKLSGLSQTGNHLMDRNIIFNFTIPYIPNTTNQYTILYLSYLMNVVDC